MRRVIPLELVGLKKYEYDLYDEKGKLIYTKGDLLTSEFLMALNFKKVYKQDRVLELDTNSKLKYDTDADTDTLKDTHYVPKESIISKEATETLAQTTREIFKAAYEGEEIDHVICRNARDIVVNEVTERLEFIEYISQLRIIDEYLYSHAVNVSILSTAIGLLLELDKKIIKDLALGALLHDVGKTKIPIEILNKPGKLTPEEFMIIINHSAYGFKILTEMGISDHIAKAALEHHERANGEGYPRGVKQREISLFGQIVAIADVYDALVSDKVYKQAVISPDALRIMLLDGANAFNMEILNKFVYLAVIEHSKHGKKF